MRLLLFLYTRQTPIIPESRKTLIRSTLSERAMPGEYYVIDYINIIYTMNFKTLASVSENYH